MRSLFFVSIEVNIKVFYKLIPSFWMSVTRHNESTQSKFSYLCNISPKAWGMKLMFCLQINIQAFTVGIRSPQGFIQAILMSYNSFFAQKRELNYLDECLSQACLKYPKQYPGIPKVLKITSSQCLYNISKKEVRDEVDFLHADKHQSFLQVDSNTLGIKVFYKVMLSLLMGIIQCYQITQSNKFAIFLQYLKKRNQERSYLFACR